MKIINHIDLLRHGEIQGGQRFFGSTDVPLTNHGWEQLWTTIEVNPPSWDHIITSPLDRCSKFAHALGQRYSIPITQDKRIKEINFGIWEGRSAAELIETDAEVLTRFWKNPINNTPTNAEHLLDFQARVLSAWRDITSNHASQKILIITHGGVIRIVLCHILQHPLERILELEVAHATMRHIQVEEHQNIRRTILVPDKQT